MLSIKCADTSALFTLSPAGDGDWLARFESPHLVAETSVYAYRGEGIVDLFASIARDWKGWTGDREWQSLEQDLLISACMDRVGHARLQIALRPDNFRRWRAEFSLVVDAGQLDDLALQAAKLVAQG